MSVRWIATAGGIVWLLAGGLFLLLPPTAHTDELSSRFDCRAQTLAQIRPGTSIADRAPEGWTHLVSKSSSRLTSGDVKKLHNRAVELAQFLFSAVLVRVESSETPSGTVYRLDEVATGLGTRIGQADVIISSKTQNELGAKLGFLERCVLSSAEKEDETLVVLARSDTSLLVDMPSMMLIDGTHRSVVLRYLFMVQPSDGRLEVVVWRIDVSDQGNYRWADAPAVRRTLGQVEQCQVHVDASQTVFGVPTSKAFARIDMPPGEPLTMPRAVCEIAGSRHLTPQMAEKLDTALRRAIGFLPED